MRLHFATLPLAACAAFLARDLGDAPEFVQALGRAGDEIADGDVDEVNYLVMAEDESGLKGHFRLVQQPAQKPERGNSKQINKEAAYRDCYCGTELSNGLERAPVAGSAQQTICDYGERNGGKSPV